VIIITCIANKFLCEVETLMKLFVRALSLLPCVALLVAAAPTARADSSISGEVWEGGTTTNVPALGSSVYSSEPTAVFTVTNSSPTNLFNFNSNGSTYYTLSSFLTSGSDGLTYQSSPVSTLGSGAAGDPIDNDLFQFEGTTTLSNGSSYSFEHDDGLILYLTGNGDSDTAVINAGGPTAATSTSFTVCASGCNAVGGTYSFILDYAEVDGAPAVLEADLPLTGPPVGTTPEPNSIVMLGTGLLAAAGMIRRRIVV